MLHHEQSEDGRMVPVAAANAPCYRYGTVGVCSTTFSDCRSMVRRASFALRQDGAYARNWIKGPDFIEVASASCALVVGRHATHVAMTEGPRKRGTSAWLTMAAARNSRRKRRRYSSASAEIKECDRVKDENSQIKWVRLQQCGPDGIDTAALPPDGRAILRAQLNIAKTSVCEVQTDSMWSPQNLGLPT
jgi:hypothetical protein